MTNLPAQFRVPFREQVAAYRLRLQDLRPTASWTDLAGSEHDFSFSVAGARDAQLLADLATAVDRAITEGTTLEAFEKDFEAIVERNGWHGWTGEEDALGRAWRMRTIYETNLKTSYMAGRFAQIMEDDVYTHLVYRHSGALDPREEHLAWDGLILPKTHPFWLVAFPPNGWGCGCYVDPALSYEHAVSIGGDPALGLRDDWAAPDPRTGLPSGIGRGWSHAPGRSSADKVRVLAEQGKHWPTAILQAFMEDVDETTRDQIATAYRALPSVRGDARRLARTVWEGYDASARPKSALGGQRSFGLLTKRHRDAVHKVWSDAPELSLFAFRVTVDDIRHVYRRHGAPNAPARGDRPITPEDFAALMGALDDIEFKRMEAKPLERKLIGQVAFSGWVWDVIWKVEPKRRGLKLTSFFPVRKS